MHGNYSEEKYLFFLSLIITMSNTALETTGFDQPNFTSEHSTNFQRYIFKGVLVDRQNKCLQ